MIYVDYLTNKISESYAMLFTMCRKENLYIWNPCEFFNSEISTSQQYVVMILNRPVALDFQPNFILNLWKNALLRVTVDGGTNRWLSWLKLNNCDQLKNVSPDLITGDMDSIAQDVLDYFSNKNKNVQIIKTPDQDETDFTKALREVQRHCSKEHITINNIIVLADTSGRFDQIIGNINTLFKAQDILPNVNVIMLASNSLTWLLKEKVVHTIDIPQKLRENQEWCALIPIANSCRVTSSGLKWNLNNTILEFGKLVSTSNTYGGDPTVTVQSDNPIIWSMGIENLL